MKIINALQIDPRISWDSLAGAFGTSPLTLARRWDALVHGGVSWQTAIRGQIDPIALVEVVCQPGTALEVAAAAALDPRIISIDLTSGRRDLLLTIAATDLRELAEYVIHRIGAIPHVVSAQTYVASDSFRLGSSWTVQAMTDSEIARLPAPRAIRAGAAKVVAPAIALALRETLAEDPRMSFASLGARMQISAQRASDYVTLLRKNGDLVLRTDVAGAYSTWPVVCWYFIQLPAAAFHHARSFFARSPETQFAAATTGGSNLLVATSAKTIADLIRREEEIEHALPGARVIDRSLVLRMFKHLGRIMGPDGRATSQRIPLVSTTDRAE